jgi:hypothetical protein
MRRSLGLFGWERDTGEGLDDCRVVFAPVASSRSGHEHLVSGRREGKRKLRRASGVEDETEILHKNIHCRERGVVICKHARYAVLKHPPALFV